MGLGDEIMALGRAERIHEQHGCPVRIVTMTEATRTHDAWKGNPAWDKFAGKKLVDGGGARPYVNFKGRKAIFNMDHTPRAGRIFLTEDERDACKLLPPYAIVAPHIKEGASPNKSWGFDNFCEVIKDFPIPVYQLMQDPNEKLATGAIAHHTPTLRHAVAAIEKAAVVVCNEGGTHHMAASMRIPAVVIFGSFIPPQVTGYEIHYNIDVKTEHGYCGNWNFCDDCAQAMKQILPKDIRNKAILMMESYNEN